MTARLERVPITKIFVGLRLRPVDPAYVETLAASMCVIGQLTPIDVQEDVDLLDDGRATCMTVSASSGGQPSSRSGSLSR